jgi:ATP-dependent DNA helicase UvrD/PcrA
MTHPDLAYEQAKNEEYLEKLEKKLKPNPRAAVDRNVIWIDGADHLQKVVGTLHPLIGRVGLDSEDEDLGRSFYIGPRRFDHDGIRVISWAAPRARDIWFQPDPDASEIAAHVVVRRMFSLRVEKITDLDDEIVREVATSPFTAAEITVPAPPGGTSRRRAVIPARAPPAGQGSKPLREESLELPATGTPQVPQMPSSAAQCQHPPKPLDDVLKRGMRAPEIVLKRLSAPRSDRLASVLPTLQPDQHRLVSWPHDEPLIVQGHPGTGKTIVATYRAAYLVNPALYEDEGPLAGRRGLRILLVGPTDAYVQYVSEIIWPLNEGGLIRLTHLERLLGDATLVKGQWGGGIGGRYSDVDAKARGLAEQAARIARANSQITEGKGSALANIKVIYDLIRSNGTTQKRISSDDAQIGWMKELPGFDRAFKVRRYLPLMAQCRIAYKRIPDKDKYDHIIVDEAQDVSPIEWNVLDQYLARDGQWSVVGDMNQRRSDTTYGSWQEIADHLGLGDGDSAFDVQTMRQGYRSTDPILRFADKLLPKTQGGGRSIQTDGPDVILERVRTAGQLLPKVVELAADLSAKHSEGTTAIITVDPGAVMQELGKHGWRKSGREAIVWSKDGLQVRLYHPEKARGLEFDAVVVVEPGAFPENVGREAQLYTSLTRANRELAVVWHAALPDKLRRLGRILSGHSLSWAALSWPTATSRPAESRLIPVPSHLLPEASWPDDTQAAREHLPAALSRPPNGLPLTRAVFWRAVFWALAQGAAL